MNIFARVVNWTHQIKRFILWVRVWVMWMLSWHDCVMRRGILLLDSVMWMLNRWGWHRGVRREILQVLEGWRGRRTHWGWHRQEVWLLWGGRECWVWSVGECPRHGVLSNKLTAHQRWAAHRETAGWCSKATGTSSLRDCCSRGWKHGRTWHCTQRWFWIRVRLCTARVHRVAALSRMEAWQPDFL